MKATALARSRHYFRCFGFAITPARTHTLTRTHTYPSVSNRRLRRQVARRLIWQRSFLPTCSPGSFAIAFATVTTSDTDVAVKPSNRCYLREAPGVVGYTISCDTARAVCKEVSPGRSRRSIDVTRTFLKHSSILGLGRRGVSTGRVWVSFCEVSVVCRSLGEDQV